MKAKMTGLMAVSVVLTAAIYQSCVENDKTGKLQPITPQDIPTNVVAGFNFPESQDTINGWLGSQDTVSITNHAWGIWAGLTANSNQVYGTDTLLIYETWLGVSDLAAACAAGNSQGGCAITKTTREQLHFPRQIAHAASLLKATPGAKAGNPTDDNASTYVSVSYNPGAACYATNNLIFNQSALSKFKVSGGIGAIPAFPNNAITIKPTYFIGKTSDGLVQIPAWQGEPTNPYVVYSPSAWNSYVYADVTNKQPKGKIAVPAPANASAQQISDATINLDEFISYPIDALAAYYMNKQQLAQTNDTLKAGDLAILTAMHVATKETSNWTWQTFFWTINPAQPDFPSSAWQAKLQPTAQLNGAAAHYALATCYAMVWPNQPVTGGTNTNARAIIGYNPYLEPGLPAPFGNVNALNSTYQYGMQTNCMSCHAYATQFKNTPYSADQYVDMKDTIFNNSVQLDFAWSINQNVNTNK